MVLISTRLSKSPGIVKASTNSPALKQGSDGEGVKTLQLAFIDLGFAMPRSTKKVGAVPDGIFGTETAAITAAFQRANGLVADGVAGAQTLARLDMLLVARSEATSRMDSIRGNNGTGRD